MVKNEITNKEHIKEVVARNTELLERGLKIVDTDVEIFAGDYVDMIAVDGKKRLIILVFAGELQTLRSNKGTHVLKEAFHAWNWFTGFKEGLLEQTEKKIGIRPVDIPPRLAVVAPGFSSGLINLAKQAARSLIDLRIYTYNKADPKAKDKTFQRISLKSGLPPAALPDSIATYHAKKLDDYWYMYGGEFAEVRKGKGYVAYSFDNLLDAVGSDFREALQRFNQDIKALKSNLRPIFRRDAIIYKDAYGNQVCTLSLHDLYGFSLLVGEKLFYWGEKPDKNKGLEEKTAIAEIESLAAALKKEVGNTL